MDTVRHGLTGVIEMVVAQGVENSRGAESMQALRCCLQMVSENAMLRSPDNRQANVPHLL